MTGFTDLYRIITRAYAKCHRCAVLRTLPFILALSVSILASPLRAQTGSVKSFQKISDTAGGFTGTLLNADRLGYAIAKLGDLDNDGITDLAVGAVVDDDGGFNRGAVWILFLNADGTVKNHQKISDTQGGFTGTLEDSDQFGAAAEALGDLDGDGVEDLVVSSTLDDDGGTDRGALWVLFLNTDGTVKSHQKISDTVGGFAGTLDDNDEFATSIANIGDLDSDGVVDIVVGNPFDDDGGASRGAAWVLFLNTDGTVKSHQKISDTSGGFTGTLINSDAFGVSVASLGDLDGDSIVDLAVGASGDDDGAASSGAVWVLFLNADGTVKNHQKISNTQGNFSGSLASADAFGTSTASGVDLNADGVNDLAVGAPFHDDGGTERGAVFVLLLNTDGTVKGFQKISDLLGNFSATLDDDDRLGGNGVEFIGDLDADGVGDLVTGAYQDDDGGTDRGAIYVLFLRRQPKITSISPTSGKVGDSVTITGTDFSPTAGNNTVFFGATEATVTAASTTSLTVAVPSGATFGPITVQVDGQTAESAERFVPTYDGVAQTITAGILAQPVDFTTGTAPQRIAMADVDGDGKSDAVAPNFSVNTISVLRNTATSGGINSSSFATKVDFAAGSQPSDVAIADFDGDGKRDIAVAHVGGGVVAVYRNTSTSGSISLAAKVDFTGGDGQLAVGDLDLDGKIDIAVRHSTNDDISVLHNTATSGSITAGSFAPKVDFTTGDNPITVEIGDIDGDGKPELVTPNRTSTTLAVHRNTTTGGVIDGSSFAAKVDFTATAGCQKVLLIDVDGDGKLDAAVTNQTGTLSLFRNTASSGTINASSLATRVDFTTAAGGDPLDMAAGDFDGDGKTDLATVNDFTNTAAVFKNTSVTGVINSSTLATKIDFPTGDTPPGIAIADIDGDGKLDLAVNSQTPNTFSVYHNIADPPAITSGSPQTGKVGDTVTINGANFDATFSNNTVFFGSTKATVTAGGATSLTTSVPTGATFGPVSVTANQRTAVSDKFFVPTFGGEFPTVDASSMAAKVDFTTATSPDGIAVGDLDGDGKPDIAVANTGSVNFSAFRNTSTSGTINGGTFAAKVDFTTGTTPVGVALGDLDRDGKLDVAISNDGSNTASVFHNTGSSGTISFAAKVDFTTGTTPDDIGIEDIDGDGFPDLVVPNRLSNTVSLFKNIGTSGGITANSFVAKVDFTTGTDPAFVSTGDIDGDAKPDVLVANYNSGSGTTFSVLRNTATAGTIDANTLAAKVDFTTDTGPFNLAVGDIDEDGKFDVVTTNNPSSTISVFRNTSGVGSVTFDPKQDFTTDTFPAGAGFGDIDGDGKADVVITEQTGPTVSVFRNTASSGSITASSLAARAPFTTATNARSVVIADFDGDGQHSLRVNEQWRICSSGRQGMLPTLNFRLPPGGRHVCYRNVPDSRGLFRSLTNGINNDIIRRCLRSKISSLKCGEIQQGFVSAICVGYVSSTLAKSDRRVPAIAYIRLLGRATLELIFRITGAWQKPIR